MKEKRFDKRFPSGFPCLIRIVGPVCRISLAAILLLLCGLEAPGTSLPAKAKDQITKQDEIRITGRVVDQHGQPLPGVTVSVPGSSLGTVTDADGNYSISLPPQTTRLQFSFVGMKTEMIEIDGRVVINLNMQTDTQSIDELVVVGYGTQKKVNLTGGVDVVKADAIEDRPIANVSQALQGTAPGLVISTNRFSGGEPGARMNWSIRGLGQPYVLVDGVPTDAHLINPEDIASVSVLKDAAASAIYGSRAPFGVVLITTKKGKKREKARLTYSSNMSWSNPIRVPEWMSSVDHARKFNYACLNSGQPAYYTDEDIQEMQDYIDGKIDYETKANGNVWDRGMNGNANNDWGDLFFRKNTLRQKHDLSIRGGGERLSYYASAGFFDQEGELNYGDISYGRQNFNSSLEAGITEWLKLSFNAKYMKQTTLTPFGEEGFDYRVHWHNMLRLTPTEPLYLPNGEINYYSRVLVLEKGGYRNTEDQDIWLTCEMELEPLKGWKSFFRYSRNHFNRNYRDLQKVYYSHYPDGTEYMSSYNSTSNFSRYYGVNDYDQINVRTSYLRSFGNHNLYLLLGFEQEQKELSGLWGLGRGQLSQDSPNIDSSLGDPAFPGYQARDAGDSWSHWATRGFFGRLTYNYLEKYLVEFNARYNGSSNFKNANTQWGFFPSASAAYVLSREAFWEPLANVINLMKIRASYGSVGNDYTEYSYTAFMPSITAVDPNASWPSNFYMMSGEPMRYADMPSIPSPTITWETVTTLNGGLDLRFLDNRLQASFDYFITERADIIIPATTEVPSVLGAPSEYVNAGKEENRGMELTLGWKDREGEFGYGIRAVVGDSRRKWTYYPKEIKTVYELDEHVSPVYTGAEEGAIWGFKTEGFFQDDSEVDAHANQTTYLYNGRWSAGDVRYADLDTNGVISIGAGTLEDHGDLVILGNRTPRFNFGITFSADYRGFDLSFFLQGIAKRDWTYLNRRHGKTKFFGYARGVGQDNYFVNHLDYWTPENTDAYLPKPYSNPDHNWKNEQVQSKYIISGAYLRLKNVQIGYTLPLSLSRKMRIERLRIYLSGENLFTLTKIPSQFDPELLGRAYLGTGKLYPLRKNISLGLSITL
ncbi:MAG: hypothetical protein CSA96_06790 [Bacteroidetes bacterium]|nr:MAG: hypothetical protein CSA96_06790 [Bacteroidota bacterium]